MEIKRFDSSEGNVSKFVFHFENAIAEAVLYKYETYKQRTVICISVQSGCPIGCVFCGTSKTFIRNLKSWEIVKQVQECLKTIDCNVNEIEKFQIMFMSMGEPFASDYEQFTHAIDYLNNDYPNADLLVSTSAPAHMYNWLSSFINLSIQIPKVGLQFSVHESTDEARSKLIPTKTSSLRQIAAMGELWAASTGRSPFFNYCVHENNSSIKDANRLVNLFDPNIWKVTLSVICEKDETVKSSINRQLDLIANFSTLLTEKGFNLRIFNPAGQDDIGGGCGQLWYVQQFLNKNK